MNELKKKNLRVEFQKICGYFTIYALLPLICGAFLGLFLLISSLGSSQTGDLLLHWGEEKLFSAVGLNRREAPFSGFYFLSGELKFPLKGEAKAVIGSAHYFETVKPQAKPESPDTEAEAPEPTPEAAPKPMPDIIYDSLPAEATPIIRVDLSSSYVINTTQYSINLEAVRKSPYPSSVLIPAQGPLVLVLHSHGTEGYFEDRTNLSDFATDNIESYFLQSETSFRTTDPQKSVVRVGAVFCQRLSELGIPTLHCTIMHDRDSYNDAYTLSAQTVQRLLKQYPTIQYVIDLHRDSITRESSYVKTYTEINGTPSAQVMLVVGTNQNGRHPNWEQNLVVATHFKDTLDQCFPTLSRSLYLRTARFNQEFLPGCMLLEVGSAANTLEEAETAAVFAAEAFAQMLQAQSS